MDFRDMQMRPQKHLCFKLLKEVRDFWISVLRLLSLLGGSKDVVHLSWDAKQTRGQKELALTVPEVCHLTETPGKSDMPPSK